MHKSNKVFQVKNIHNFIFVPELIKSKKKTHCPHLGWNHVNGFKLFVLNCKKILIFKSCNLESKGRSSVVGLKNMF